MPVHGMGVVAAAMDECDETGGSENVLGALDSFTAAASISGNGVLTGSAAAPGVVVGVACKCGRDLEQGVITDRASAGAASNLTGSPPVDGGKPAILRVPGRNVCVPAGEVRHIDPR